MSVSDPPFVSDGVLHLTVEFISGGLNDLGVSHPQLRSFLVDVMNSWFGVFRIDRSEQSMPVVLGRFIHSNIQLGKSG